MSNCKCGGAGCIVCNPIGERTVMRVLMDGIRAATDLCFEAAVRRGWWTDLETGESLLPKLNHGEKFMLIVSEVSEAMEGVRKNLMDEKLPHRKAVEVELADALIRIFDYAGATGLDLAGAVREKMEYNATREDHNPETRRKAGGKAF